MAINRSNTRTPEHVLSTTKQPTQRQIQPHKIVVQAEIHAPMETPSEPKVPIDALKIDEPDGSREHLFSFTREF